MFTVNRVWVFFTLFVLLTVQVEAEFHLKAKKGVKGPSDKEQLKEMSERLDIISQATDHFKFFRDCFVDYEDPSDISTLSKQLEEARDYLPRSLHKLEERIKKFSTTAKKSKGAVKLLSLSGKLRHKINAVIKLTSDDVKRIELGMKKYMSEMLLGKGSDQFVQEATEISNTLKRLRSKECVSGSCVNFED